MNTPLRTLLVVLVALGMAGCKDAGHVRPSEVKPLSVTGDVKPYEFAQVTAPSGARISIYKMVYQGCELFIAAGEAYTRSGGEVANPSLALGRGCK